MPHPTTQGIQSRHREAGGGGGKSGEGGKLDLALLFSSLDPRNSLIGKILVNSCGFLETQHKSQNMSVFFFLFVTNNQLLY